MKKFKVRKWEMDFESFSVKELTMEEIIKDPYHLNMADIGFILLNERRAWEGLESIPDCLVLDSVQDFENRGADEQ